MDMNAPIDEWNNPLIDISSGYSKNGLFTDNSGKFEVLLSPDELLLVISYLMLGMNKVEMINKNKLT